MKIFTPHGTIALASSSVARLDVTPQATEISVRKGRVIVERRGGAAANGTWNIDQGHRIRLEVNVAKPVRAAPFNRDAMDIFDRWALGLLVVGNVVRVDGRVIVTRRTGESLDSAISAQIEEGDRLVTAMACRAWLKLNPRTSLYINEASEIRMATTDKSLQRIELLRGAILLLKFDRSYTFEANTEIEIHTPMGSVSISKSGEYRMDSSESGIRIAVRAGSLLLSPESTSGITEKIRLKQGQVAILPSGKYGRPQISRLGNFSNDLFDLWIISTIAIGPPASIR